MKSISPPHRILVVALHSVALLLALPLLYFLAILIGGVVPANAGWQPPSHGITIFVRTNGVHTWLMVPAVTEYMDWRNLAPAQDIADPARTGNYLAIGYGNREFYLNTPTWSDLTVERALGAAFGGGPSLVHVEHERDPRPDRYQQSITLTPDQYRRLTSFIVSSFEISNGRSLPLTGRGYGPADIFYEARGGYSLFYTCNEWTGEALRTAGVRVGVWTPLSQSIMLRFPPPEGP